MQCTKMLEQVFTNAMHKIKYYNISVILAHIALPFSGRTQRGQIFDFFFVAYINLMFSLYSSLCVKIKFLLQVVFGILAK